MKEATIPYSDIENVFICT